MKKSFRVGMALLLVLALVLYLSPVRVSASALPEVASVVTKVIPFNPGAAAAAGGAALGVQVFAWVCAGLGVIIATDQLIERAKEYQEFSGDLEIGLFYYPDGTWSYGVDMNFVQRVHAFLWQTGIVVKNTELELDAVRYPPADALAEAKAANYSVLVYYRYNGSSLFYHLVYSNESQIEVKTSSGLTISTVDKGTYLYYWQDSTQKFIRFKDTAVSGNRNYVAESVQHFGQLILPDVQITIDGAELGNVADPGTLDNDEGWQNSPYREWHTNQQPARSPQTGEEVVVLPIPLIPNGTAALPDGVTQPDVWQGSQAEQLPNMQPAPDGSLAQTPWEGVQDWLTPSGEPGQFGIQLRDYFPFCIPFDLYDFLTVLAAEPEAPCFVWEVPVPQMGRTFTVEVDLSAWDSVAALFRKLELLAFIVGLGWVTREKIRG